MCVHFKKYRSYLGLNTVLREVLGAVLCAVLCEKNIHRQMAQKHAHCSPLDSTIITLRLQKYQKMKLKHTGEKGT